jgi:pimeloyl-ACP methyl ester carboxylesterase
MVTFDGRGRGESRPSRRYSLQADLADFAAVLVEIGLCRPILVGWSSGAAVAVRYAAEHPGEVAGLVLVDGGFPVSLLSEEDKRRARRSFRRVGPAMRVLAALGRSAKMAPDEAADLVFELDELAGTLDADYDSIEVPIDFVVGSKRHAGSTAEQCQAMRASLEPLVNRRANVSLFSTVPASHTRILAKHPDVVANAVNDVARRSGQVD